MMWLPAIPHVLVSRGRLNVPVSCGRYGAAALAVPFRSAAPHSIGDAGLLGPGQTLSPDRTAVTHSLGPINLIDSRPAAADREEQLWIRTSTCGPITPMHPLAAAPLHLDILVACSWSITEERER
jgi:hypothetical protein